MLFMIFVSFGVSATIINIPVDYPAIQQGIDASVDGDTVLVQPGTYVENINFNGHNIVLGSLFLTTGDTSYIEQTIIDGDSAGTVVKFWGNEDSTAAISGFTLQRGNAEYGGGISCYHSTPRVSQNVIRQNAASAGGGGIDCYVANPSIIANSIIENSSDFVGGGIYCNGASPLILDNSIRENWTRSYGGGIYCRYNSNAGIIENEIMENHGYGGGGIYVTVSDPVIDGNRISGNAGHGIFCDESEASIRNNSIDRNSAGSGAGIYVNGSRAPAVEHNLIYNNISSGSGGGITCESDASFINNTIVGNTSGNGGGGLLSWYCAPTLKNNIFWGNVADFAFQIYPIGNPVPIVSYCDVQGGWGGQGNIDDNPLFVNTSTDNYNICLGSPCIDTGDPDLLDPDSTRSDIGVYYEEHPECYAGNTWYVSISGNDTTGDGSQNNPFRTIQHAIDISNHSDSVIADNGIYEENIDFTGKRIMVTSNFIFSNDTLDIQNTIIKGDSVSATVTMVSGEDSMTTIAGFTIRDGGDSGIKCSNSNPNILFNIITDNISDKGAGIRCDYSNPAIKFNVIKDNTTEGGYVYGAGISCFESAAIISRNRIFNNSTEEWGGGIYILRSHAVISYNEIYNNSGDRGGGISCGSYDSSLVKNNIIYNNIANEPNGPGNGGGVYTYNSSTVFCNNTITGNIARWGGALYAGEASDPSFLNSILWDNTSQFGGEIEVYRADPILAYCDIQGGWPGTGNLDMNPLFRDPDNEDYHLMSVACGDLYNSPGIDTGHPDSIDGFLDCFWGLGGIRSDMGAFGGGDSTMTDIQSPPVLRVERFDITKNYPNPFNSFTVIEYNLQQDAVVSVDVYDILGRRVESLMKESLEEAGQHSIVWKAENCSSGIYLYSIQIGENKVIKKCLLLK